MTTFPQLELDMSEWNKQTSEDYFRLSNWSDGYYVINDKGNLAVSPKGRDGKTRIDMFEVIQEVKKKNVEFPVVVRFHDILRSRVTNLNKIFRSKISEYKYQGQYLGVYPVKVNQLREVVEEVLSAGAEYNYGLEAGSKAELLAVLSQNTPEESITIANGYKDTEFLKLCMLGRKMGKKIIVVIEKYSELPRLIKCAREMKVEPIIGFRAKLSSKGSGKWASSTGERAKFGLTIPEILKGWQLLKKHNMEQSLQLLHFHIGSQIPDIRTFKDSITEGARIYAKLSQIGANIQFFDVGGGVGVDYDGTRSDSNSSINYSIKDYVSDVVYILKEICDLEKVNHPNIVTESGRSITAHHSCVITNVFGKIEYNFDHNTSEAESEHNLVRQMREIWKGIGKKTYREAYYDSNLKKEEASNAFKLGILTLEERAKIESIYYKISHKICEIIDDIDKELIPHEIQNLKDTLSNQYLCNFSVFQSIPDSWAIDQVIPIVPIHRLDEEPTENCTLADITCDSDGKVAQFIGDEYEHSPTVRLHKLNEDEDYYLGFFLTGAYQDIMGDMHNLFGRLNEVHVFYDKDDESQFYVEEIIRGQSNSDVLKIMQYNSEILAINVKLKIDDRVRQGKIKPREGVELIDFYESCLDVYTYLTEFKD
jgi:arginine decarboxylase